MLNRKQEFGIIILLMQIFIKIKKSYSKHFRANRNFGVQLISTIVAGHGLFILATSLIFETNVRHNLRLSSLLLYLPLLLGFTLLYLAAQLRSHKQTAWVVTLIAYSLYIGLSLSNLGFKAGFEDTLAKMQLVRLFILPALILILLYIYRKQFVVRSDIQSFGLAARFSAVALLVAFTYGVVGFSLFDIHDFHEEITPITAAHYTIDQFDLTTSHNVTAYTKRANIFQNSLSIVSVVAIGYVILSLFQPLKMKYYDQEINRQRMLQLLMDHPSTSEDYFKLWPHDKTYFFEDHGQSGIAFHAYNGVALCLGDPVGDKKRFGHLINQFEDLCFGNDWLPAMIHIQETNHKLYESNGYSLQKIGQEAVININNFQNDVATNKYFRHIRNKFTKQGYTYELLLPPHHSAIIDRLSIISKEWLSDGGHDERGFAMGYFSPEYMQQCPVVIVRDAAGTIQAFLNQLPADFDKQEATYDLLRNTRTSLGNINDYLLMSFITTLQEQGYNELNLGLCPLVGLDEQDQDKNTFLDGVLRFAYANGDRFYSFSGLYKFKVKYEPEWRDRFIAYKLGVRGFTRTTNSLMRVMRVK